MAENNEKNIKEINDPLKILDEIESIGKKEKWINVSNDYKVLLTTINAEEEVEIFKACRNELGFGYLAKNKFEVLARAIKGVNDKKFKYLEMESGLERTIERERTIEIVRKKIESWQDDIVNFIYAEWIDLINEGEKYLKKIGIIVDREIEEKLNELENDLEEAAQNADMETKKLKKEDVKNESE